MNGSKLWSKKIFFLLCSVAIMLLGCAGCGLGAGTTENEAAAAENTAIKNIDGKKILVMYFSASGTTQKMAESVQRMTGADIYEIQAAEPYPARYRDIVERAHQERDANSRPAFSGSLPDLRRYDVIFLGYPVWSHQAPRVVMKVLESGGFDGKIIAPFCTSAESPIEETLPEIRAALPRSTWQPGLRARNESDIKNWLQRMGWKL